MAAGIKARIPRDRCDAEGDAGGIVCRLVTTASLGKIQRVNTLG